MDGSALISETLKVIRGFRQSGGSEAQAGMQIGRMMWRGAYDSTKRPPGTLSLPVLLKTYFADTGMTKDTLRRFANPDAPEAPRLTRDVEQRFGAGYRRFVERHCTACASRHAFVWSIIPSDRGGKTIELRDAYVGEYRTYHLAVAPHDFYTEVERESGVLSYDFEIAPCPICERQQVSVISRPSGEKRTGIAVAYDGRIHFILNGLLYLQHLVVKTVADPATTPLAGIVLLDVDGNEHRISARRILVARRGVIPETPEGYNAVKAFLAGDEKDQNGVVNSARFWKQA